MAWVPSSRLFGPLLLASRRLEKLKMRAQIERWDATS
jgi:hypothetical protein